LEDDGSVPLLLMEVGLIMRLPLPLLLLLGGHCAHMHHVGSKLGLAHKQLGGALLLGQGMPALP
jgi:hypothetical protein